MNKEKNKMPAHGAFSYREMLQHAEVDSAANGVPEDQTEAKLGLCTALVRANGHELNDMVDHDFMRRVAAAAGDRKAGAISQLIVPTGANGQLGSALDLFVHAYNAMWPCTPTDVTREAAKPVTVIRPTAVASAGPVTTQNSASEVIGKPGGAWIPCQLVLALVQREAAARGDHPGLIAATISTILAFLAFNGYSVESLVGSEFADDVAAALKGGSLHQHPRIKLPPGVQGEVGYLDKIAAFARAHRALAEADFSGTVIRWLEIDQQLTYEQICSHSGLPATSLKTWVADRYKFTTNVTAEQALKLDRILGAGGQVFSSYVATMQHVAYETPPTIRDQILGRRSFRQELRNFRNGAKLTKDELQSAVEKLSKTSLSKRLISSWETGSHVPSQGMRDVIDALDEICGAGGELFAAWLAENPRELYPPYSLPVEQWPECVRAQLDRIILYKTANPENLPRSQSHRDRWSVATIEYFTEFCQSFLGFLRHEKQFKDESLSLSLLCDWDLVQGCFDFVRARTGRTNYSLQPKTMTRTLLNLYTYFMPATFGDVVQEPHWAERITLQIELQVAVAEMVERPETRKFTGLDESWNYHLALTKGSARSFLSENRFDDDLLTGKARPLLEAGVRIDRIFAELAIRAERLPLLILCRKSAILLRRLALAALLVASNLTPATLRSLRCSQISMSAGRWIQLDIPASQFRSRGQGGSQGGVVSELPNIGWLNDLIWRYLTEARPLLLEAAGERGGDEGYFFIPAVPRRAPGCGLSKKELATDVGLVLGYNPFAQRHIYLLDASTKESSDEEKFTSLQTTSDMVQRTIKRFAAIKTVRANRASEDVLGNKTRRPSKKGRWGAP